MFTINFVQYVPFAQICIFCFWFCLGVYAYNNLLTKNSLIKLHIDNLSFVELFLLLYPIAFTFSVLLGLSEDLLVSFIDLDHNSILHNITGEENTSRTNPVQSTTQNNSTATASSSPGLETTSQNSNSTGNLGSNARDTANKAGNSAIMIAALSVGNKLAQKTPSVAGKIAAGIASVGMGAAAIIAKDAAANLNGLINKNKYMSWFVANNSNSSNILDSILDLTGNSAIDLLIIIQVFHKLQLMLIPLIAYNLLLHFISEEKMESTLLKVFPVAFVNVYMKSFRIFKKQSIFIILALILLVYISNYLAYYYLDFYLSNIDRIIDICFKDLNK
jgi:hypothetical protein